MMKNVSFENTVEFKDIDELYLPENCMICGDETENRIEKTEFGYYTSTKDYKKDFKLKLPVCDECNSKINLDSGKSEKILMISVLLGIILGIIIYFLTYTILLSIAVFIVFFIFPFINYRAKIKPRIKLDDFLEMKVIPNEDLIQFTFINKEYARYVNKINSEMIEAKKIKTEKLRLEKIEAEKINAERVKFEKIEAEKIKAENLRLELIEAEKMNVEKVTLEEIEVEKITTEKAKLEEIEAEEIKAEVINDKEKVETVEHKSLLTTNKENEQSSVIKSQVDGELKTLTVIPLTEDINKNKENPEMSDIRVIPPVSKKCPKCQSIVKPGWKFCVFCSEVLKE